MGTVDELLGCDRCGTTVRMRVDTAAETFTVTCDCATRVYPGDRYGLGDLPPPSALAPGWRKRRIEEPDVETHA